MIDLVLKLRSVHSLSFLDNRADDDGDDNVIVDDDLEIILQQLVGGVIWAKRMKVETWAESEEVKWVLVVRVAHVDSA